MIVIVKKKTIKKNKNKPLIIVNDENQEKIRELIGKQLDENPSVAIANYNETLVKQKERLVNAKNVCEGKKTSYNFFNNMLERIKKTTEKTILKYEKLIKKEQKRDNNSDSESDSESDDDDDDQCGICLNEYSGYDVGV